MEKLLLFVLSDSTSSNVVEYVFTDLLSFLKKHDELTAYGNHVLSYRCQRVTIDEFFTQFTI